MANPIKPKKYVNLQDTFKNKFVRIISNVTDFDGALEPLDENSSRLITDSDDSDFSLWIVYPLGDGIYMFIHYNTGKVLTHKDFLRPNSDDYNASTLENYIGDATQQYTLETNDNINLYSIRNVNDGGLVTLYSDSVTAWSFEAVNDMNISDQLPSVQTLDPFPVYADLENNLPDETPDRLISYTLLPAPTVQDGQLTLKQKIQTSPYYLMEKHQYWTQLQQLSLAPGQTTIKQYEYGMDTTQADEMTKTTGMTIHEDAGLNFSLGGIFGGSAAIRKEITDNLVIHESISTKTSEKVSKTSTFDNSNNQYTMYYAKYILTTKFVLKRFSANEDVNITVGTWISTDPNTIRTTSWIPDVPKTDCTECPDGVDCSECPDCPQCQEE